MQRGCRSSWTALCSCTTQGWTWVRASAPRSSRCGAGPHHNNKQQKGIPTNNNRKYQQTTTNITNKQQQKQCSCSAVIKQPLVGYRTHVDGIPQVAALELGRVLPAGTHIPLASITTSPCNTTTLANHTMAAGSSTSESASQVRGRHQIEDICDMHTTKDMYTEHIHTHTHTRTCILAYACMH